MNKLERVKVGQTARGAAARKMKLKNLFLLIFVFIMLTFSPLLTPSRSPSNMVAHSRRIFILEKEKHISDNQFWHLLFSVKPSSSWSPLPNSSSFVWVESNPFPLFLMSPSSFFRERAGESVEKCRWWIFSSVNLFFFLFPSSSSSPSPSSSWRKFIPLRLSFQEWKYFKLLTNG